MSAFSAAEARWLAQPDTCDRCGSQAEPGSALCAAHEDEQYDYDRDAAEAREDRAEAKGRSYL